MTAKRLAGMIRKSILDLTERERSCRREAAGFESDQDGYRNWTARADDIKHAIETIHALIAENSRLKGAR